jgi:arylsulfatase A-like enzyme
MLGLPVADEFQGYDWSSVLQRRQAPPAERDLFFQAHRGAVQNRSAAKRARIHGLLEVGIITAGDKEIYRITRRTRKRYDLADDPGELKNLVGRRSEPSQALRDWALEIERALRNEKNQPESLDETDLEMLRSLGYIE